MHNQNIQLKLNITRGNFIMKYVRGIVFVCCLALLPAQTHADLIFSASDITVEAGTTATVDFYVSDTDESPGSLLGLSYGVDFGDNDSTALPEGLSFAGITSSGLFTSVVSNAAPEVANYDVQVDVFNLPPPLGIAVNLTNAPQVLFSLEFEIADDVAVGTVFDIDILGAGETSPNNIFATTDGSGSAFSGVVVTGAGSITIVGVPEPGSVVLMLAFGGGLALRRRRC